MESSDKSCEEIVSRINQFIMDQRAKVKNIKVEQFNKHRDSLLTRISARDQSQHDENARFWAEIGSHNKDFKRQEKEIGLLKNITKYDFKAFFENFFFNKPKRLDL